MRGRRASLVVAELHDEVIPVVVLEESVELDDVVML